MTCANHALSEESLRTCARCGEEFCPDCVIVLQGNVLCAECKDDHVRDVISGIETGLPLAPFGRRIVALLIDRGILWLLSIVLPIWASGFAEKMLGLDYDLTRKVGMTLFWSMYVANVLYEAKFLEKRGQTLGKIVARIKVVRIDGSPISAKQAWGRAIARGMFIWALQLVNYAPAPVSAEKTCIHDLLARTRVVNVRD